MTVRVSRESSDIVKGKIQILKQIIPECFTEGTLDIEKLKNTVGQTLDSNDEKYTLNWAGRNDTFKNIQIPIRDTLVPNKNESVKFDDTENIFIEGENLEVLKLLQRSYFGKIKMIYIDPPYNTGKDLIYKDNFHEDISEYLKETGQSKDGIKLTTNPETSGRFHSDWISSMYARLFIARDLLTDDGVIFVSIDDKEVHNLKLIMNEIFGEENFITNIIWEGGLKNDSTFFSISHDHILCYVKNQSLLKNNKTKWRLEKKGIDSIYEQVKKLNENSSNHQILSKELKKWYGELDKNDPAWKHRHYDDIDENGVFFGGDISWPGSGGPRYDVIHPKTRKPVKIPRSGWRYSKQEKMNQQIRDNKIQFGIDETTVPKIKRYLHETEGQVYPSVIYKDRRAAKQTLDRLFHTDIFDDPKDVNVIKDLIRLITERDDIILDFFAGSGTTAHAVMELNKDDEGNRKFICIQIPEIIIDKPKNKSTRDFLKQIKKPINIAEICKERIRRVIKNIDPNSDLDLGFKVFKLAKSNYKIWENYLGKDEKELEKQIKLFESPLIEKYTDEDVIYECIIKEGYNFNSKIEKLKIKSNTVYKITDTTNSFYICLDKTITDDIIKEVKIINNDILICIDAALDDSQKTNLSNQCNLKTL